MKPNQDHNDNEKVENVENHIDNHSLNNILENTEVKNNENNLKNGIVIGTLVHVSDKSEFFIDYHGNPFKQPIFAYSTVRFIPNDVGKNVALMFESGKSDRPIIMGPIIEPGDTDYSEKHVPREKDNSPINMKVDGEKFSVNVEKEIELKCGKSSIKLTKTGKIIIRGEYVSSRANGVHRIKRGSIQLN